MFSCPYIYICVYSTKSHWHMLSCFSGKVSEKLNRIIIIRITIRSFRPELRKFWMKLMAHHTKWVTLSMKSPYFRPLCWNFYRLVSFWESVFIPPIIILFLVYSCIQSSQVTNIRSYRAWCYTFILHLLIAFLKDLLCSTFVYTTRYSWNTANAN